MNAQKTHLYEIVTTAIIVRDGKFLITQRSQNKKRFPGMWTVPGGHLESKDYLDLPKDSEFYWYNVLERTLRREITEEVGIEVKNIEYVTSLATVHQDGNPSLVISCMADYVSGDVVLSNEDEAYEWVSLEEAKSYNLIDGIYDEMVMVDKQRKGIKSEWERDK